MECKSVTCGDTVIHHLFSIGLVDSGFEGLFRGFEGYGLKVLDTWLAGFISWDRKKPLDIWLWMWYTWFVRL